MTKTRRSPVAFDYEPTSWWKGGNDIQTLIGCTLNNGPRLGPCVCLLTCFFFFIEGKQSHDTMPWPLMFKVNVAYFIPLSVNSFYWQQRCHVDQNICCCFFFGAFACQLNTANSDETSTGTWMLFSKENAFWLEFGNVDEGYITFVMFFFF